MVFDLLSTPLHFNLENTIHDINIHPEIIEEDIMINVAMIDGVQLFDVSYKHHFENPKFLFSNEIFTIHGMTSEGLPVQYNLTMSHLVGENGEDIYTPISFFQAK